MALDIIYDIFKFTVAFVFWLLIVRLHQNLKFKNISFVGCHS